MPEDPNFAELVVYHLTKETWSNRERYNAQRNENDNVMKRITAETSVLNRKHLELLQEHEAFRTSEQKKILEASWKDWCRLGRHRNGEEQRYNLYLGNMLWVERRDLFAGA